MKKGMEVPAPPEDKEKMKEKRKISRRVRSIAERKEDPRPVAANVDEDIEEHDAPSCCVGSGRGR